MMSGDESTGIEVGGKREMGESTRTQLTMKEKTVGYGGEDSRLWRRRRSAMEEKRGEKGLRGGENRYPIFIFIFSFFLFLLDG